MNRILRFQETTPIENLLRIKFNNDTGTRKGELLNLILPHMVENICVFKKLLYSNKSQKHPEYGCFCML